MRQNITLPHSRPNTVGQPRNHSVKLLIPLLGVCTLLAANTLAREGRATKNAVEKARREYLEKLAPQKQPLPWFVDKYPSVEVEVVRYECSESSGYPIVGIVAKSKALVEDFGDPAELCREFTKVVSKKEFCSSTRSDVEYCKNGSANLGLLRSGGLVGQDCETWSAVIAYHEDPASFENPENLQLLCGRHRRLLIGCGNDVTHGAATTCAGAGGAGGYDKLYTRMSGITGSFGVAALHFHAHCTPNYYVSENDFHDLYTYSNCADSHTHGSKWNRPWIQGFGVTGDDRFVHFSEQWEATFCMSEQTSAWASAGPWHTVRIRGSFSDGYITFPTGNIFYEGFEDECERSADSRTMTCDENAESISIGVVSTSWVWDCPSGWRTLCSCQGGPEPHAGGQCVV